MIEKSWSYADNGRPRTDEKGTLSMALISFLQLSRLNNF